MIVSRFFAAMLLNGLAQLRRHRRNLRALVLRIARVQHPHRNALLHRRQNRRRMQHLRAEVRQLRRLFEADRLHAQRIGTDARIGGHDAVDVRPDLDRSGVQSAAHQRSGVVAAAASQRGRDAVRRRADKAAHHRRLAASTSGSTSSRSLSSISLSMRDRLAVVVVGDDAAARVHMRAVEATLRKGRRHHAARKPLAEAHHQIIRSRGQLADRRNAAQQIVQRIELCDHSSLQHRADRSHSSHAAAAAQPSCR